MKLTLLTFWMTAVALASAPTAWYDSEIVHNTIHEYLDLTAELSGRLTEKDRPALREGLASLKASAERLHDEMENDPEAPARVILAAFRALEGPFDRFVRGAREAQVKGSDKRAHLYDALGVVEVHGRLKYYLTPVP